MARNGVPGNWVMRTLWELFDKHDREVEALKAREFTYREGVWPHVDVEGHPE